MDFLHFILSTLKLAVASLIVGAGLSWMNVSAADVLARTGLTPEKIAAHAEKAIAWATPNLIVGAMVVLPLWALMALFRPPRARG